MLSFSLFNISRYAQNQRIFTLFVPYKGKEREHRFELQSDVLLYERIEAAMASASGEQAGGSTQPGGADDDEPLYARVDKGRKRNGITYTEVTLMPDGAKSELSEPGSPSTTVYAAVDAQRTLALKMARENPRTGGRLTRHDLGSPPAAPVPAPRPRKNAPPRRPSAYENVDLVEPDEINEEAKPQVRPPALPPKMFQLAPQPMNQLDIVVDDSEGEEEEEEDDDDDDEGEQNARRGKGYDDDDDDDVYERFCDQDQQAAPTLRRNDARPEPAYSAMRRSSEPEYATLRRGKSTVNIEYNDINA